VRVALADGDGVNRVYFRLWKWWFTTLTVLATAWLVTLGPIPAVLALVVAKHVLVAILVIGLDVDAKDRPEA
jgi:hypothetical protein